MRHWIKLSSRIGVLALGVFALALIEPTEARAATTYCSTSCETTAGSGCKKVNSCTAETCMSEEGNWYPFTLQCGSET